MAGADAALAQRSEPPGELGVLQILGRRTNRSEFRHSKRVVSGLGIIVVMVLFSFVGPLIYHTNQVAVNLANINLPPGNGHPLGTDIYGTDVLGRLMVGGRSSLELSLSVAIASTFIGAVYGAISGMLGGMMDGSQMRIVDTIQAIPSFILT